MFQLAKKHQKYQQYNPTNIDWIGDIPNGWNIKKLKFLSRIKTGDGDTQDSIPDGKYPFFVRSDTIERINRYGFDGEAILTAGDGVGVGKVFHYVNEKFAYHQRVYGITHFREVVGKYLFYFIKYNFYKEVLKASAKSTVDSLRLPMFLNFPITFPVLKEEQQKIAHYLDEKTAVLDEAIAKKKKQIELLAEHRTALINNAITKGLNSNVEMKDSGLEWVGCINKYWSVEPLKRLVKDKITDGPHTTPDFIDDDNAIPFVSVEAVKNGKLDFNYRRGNISMDLHREYSEKCHPQRDDIFLVKSGSTTGKVAMVDVDFEFSVWSPLALIRARLDIALPRFVFYAMNSNIFQNQVQLFWSFGTQPNIGMGVIETLVIPVPSIKEQNEIVLYLDNEMKYIDDMIAKIEKSIELLEEYKTSLISHVVSGKIRVS